jgi:hypothetical protein
MPAEQYPVFIGGLDRTGKTRLRLMLSAHPRLSFTRRTYLWPRFYQRFGDLAQPQNLDRCLERILKQRSIQALRPDAEQIRREFQMGEPSYARLFALFHQQYARANGKARWGEQLGNIEKYARPIYAAFPEARIIHMVRSPIERYEGTGRKGRLSSTPGWSAARWLESIRLAHTNLQAFPGRYRVVRYEDLLHRPEKTLRHICAFIGEQYLPEMLGPENWVRAADREDQLELKDYEKTQPLPSGRSIAFLQAVAGKPMRDHGYTPQPVHLELRDRIALYLLDYPFNLAGMLLWYTLGSRQAAKPA